MTQASARTDWENRIGLRSDDAVGAAPRLDPPTGLVAEAGGHQVTLTWDAVPGAVGYQVYVSSTVDGDLEPLDHHGRDVLAVPHPPYVDTTGAVGEERFYAVATLSDVAVQGAPSQRVSATPLPDAGPVTVAVDAAGDLGVLDRPWRPMIGSEHLSHAVSADTTGGRVIGEELSSALRAAHDELGVAAVRAHGILCDDLGVYREVDGEPVHDFTGVDRVYDHIRSTRALPGRGALLHAARPGERPDEEGLRLRRDRVATQGLGPLARPGARPGPARRRPVRPRRGASSTGPSRSGTRRTSRCSGPGASTSGTGSTT